MPPKSKEQLIKENKPWANQLNIFVNIDEREREERHARAEADRIAKEEANKKLEIFDGMPWKPATDRVTPQLRDFVIGLHKILKDNNIRISSPTDYEFLRIYNDNAGGPAMNSDIADWNVAEADLRMGRQTMDIEYFESLYKAAKEGRLVFNRPGELLKDAKAIMLDDKNSVSLSEEPSPLAANDPLANDAQRAQKLLDKHSTLNLKELNNEHKTIELPITAASSEGYDKGFSADQFVKEIAKMKPVGENNLKELIADSNYEGSAIKLKKFSSREKKQRKAVSEAAIKNYARSAYNSYLIKKSLDLAVERGEITKAESLIINNSRDILDIVLLRGDSEEVINTNIETLKLMAGKGISKDDPNYADLRAQKYAAAFNNAMKRLASKNFDQYKDMSDEFLVNNYEAYHDAMKPISIFKKEYEALLETNKYIDKDLGNQLLDVEDRLAGEYLYNSVRMRLISNSYYESYDFNDFADLPFEDRLNFSQILSEDANDVNLARFLGEADVIGSSKGEIYNKRILDQMNKSGVKASIDDVMFFDQNGERLLENYVIEASRKGQTVYCTKIDEPDNIAPFKYNKKTQQAESGGKKPDEDTLETIKAHIKDEKKIRTEAAKREAKEKEERERTKQYENKSESLENYMSGVATTSLSRSMDGIIKEAFKKDLSVNELADIVTNHIWNDELKTSYDQFCTQIGVPENEKLSPEEINHRKALSASAVQQIFAAGKEVSDGNRFPSEKYSFGGMSARQFAYVMCEPGAGNLEKNKGLFETMDKGTPQEKKEMLEQRYKELIERCKKAFGRQYTDEELIENYAELSTLGVALGMEYDEFKRGVVKVAAADNFTIDPQLQKQMDELHEQAYIFNNYYNTRMEYMATPYFKYGGEKQLSDPEKYMTMVASEDIDMRRSGFALIEYSPNSSLAKTDYIINEITKAEGKPEYVYYIPDVPDPKNPEPVLLGKDGVNVRAGGKLVVYSDLQSEPKVVEISDNKFPPKTVTKKATEVLDKATLGNLTKRTILTSFDDRSAAIEKSNLSPARKEFESDLFYSQYRLSAIVNNPHKEANRENVKNALGDYMARLAVRKMCDHKDLDENTIKDLTSKKNIKAFRRDLIKSELVESMMKKIPDTGEGIMSMTHDKMYKMMLEALSKMGPEKDRSAGKLKTNDEPVLNNKKNNEQPVLDNKNDNIMIKG